VLVLAQVSYIWLLNGSVLNIRVLNLIGTSSSTVRFIRTWVETISSATATWRHNVVLVSICDILHCGCLVDICLGSITLKRYADLWSRNVPQNLLSILLVDNILTLTSITFSNQGRVLRSECLSDHSLRNDYSLILADHKISNNVISPWSTTQYPAINRHLSFNGEIIGLSLLNYLALRELTLRPIKLAVAINALASAWIHCLVLVPGDAWGINYVVVILLIRALFISLQSYICWFVWQLTTTHYRGNSLRRL